jgi:hypothetical protein
MDSYGNCGDRDWLRSRRVPCGVHHRVQRGFNSAVGDRLFGTYRMHAGERWAEKFRSASDYMFRLAVAGFFLYLAWWLADAEMALQACR